MGTAVRRSADSRSLLTKEPEAVLARRDDVLRDLLRRTGVRWNKDLRAPEPIWGLVRVIMAQQVSTSVAIRNWSRVASNYPGLVAGNHTTIPDATFLQGLGLPKARAHCCGEVLLRAAEILARTRNGELWEDALAGIKGIGPWTLAIFRIFVLKDPDVLPMGDVGLTRAFQSAFGARASLPARSERWRPFRSVACWHLWRTLGNEPLG